MFKKLEGDTALIRHNGVYKHVDLYSLEGKLFAKAFGGFIRLKKDGSTSKDSVFLEVLAYEGPLYADRFGRLDIEKAPGCTHVVPQNTDSFRALPAD